MPKRATKKKTRKPRKRAQRGKGTVSSSLFRMPSMINDTFKKIGEKLKQTTPEERLVIGTMLKRLM
jgi:hypothetical protein